MADVEIFSAAGVLAGSTVRVPLTNDGPDLESPFAVADARWFPIDGGPPTSPGDVIVQPDDVLLVVVPEADITVHMAWYPVTVDLGPYRVSGEIATHPGFDPERALTRPGHTFVALRDATIELLDEAGVDGARREHVHVNRYAVEQVQSMLMLGYHFPGARFASQEPVPVA